jgi:hypothetical protein
VGNLLGSVNVIKKEYPVVYMEWIDAEVDNSWRDDDDVNKELVGNPVKTIGYLIRKPSKKFAMYMVASTVAYDGDTRLHNAIIKIPKQWVVEMRFINLEETKHDDSNKQQG